MLAAGWHVVVYAPHPSLVLGAALFCFLRKGTGMGDVKQVRVKWEHWLWLAVVVVTVGLIAGHAAGWW